MNQEGKDLYEAQFRQYLQASISRAQMFKATAAGLVAASVPAVALAAGSGTGRAPYLEFPFYPQVKSGSYTPEAITDIINVAVTAEYLAVTVLTAALNNASQLQLSGLILQATQAALTEELAHLQVLRDVLGAKPLTTTFTVPNPKILTDQTTFFSTLEVAENIFVAAYMTAVREFAELGQPTLAKIAYQTGATEAEHRVIVRAALVLGAAHDTSKIPPNNKAYETDLLLYVRDAATILTNLGFIGGSGLAAAYPGDAAAIAAAGPMYVAVIQKTPNNASSTVTVTGPADLTGERASG